MWKLASPWHNGYTLPKGRQQPQKWKLHIYDTKKKKKLTPQSDIYLIFHSQHKTTAPQAVQFSCSRTHLPNKSHSSCLVTQLPLVSSWDVPVPLAVVKVLLVTQQGRWVLELRGEIWLAPHGVQCLSPAHGYSVCSGTLGQGHSCNVFHKLTVWDVK